MNDINQLFSNNRTWAEGITESRPDYFETLSKQQHPEYLWIGCSDSRVPANQIVGLEPGEVFVHRNIANVVVHSDMNCLSVLEYAVAVLEVKHIIVCGHHGCGGVQAAMGDTPIGLIDNWLRHIRDVRQRYYQELVAIEDRTERLNKLCELNVVEQVNNVCYTSIVQEAWRRGQNLSIHGVVYSLQDGLLRDLGLCIRRPLDVRESYRLVVA